MSVVNYGMSEEYSAVLKRHREEQENPEPDESDGQRWRRKNREDRAARERGVAFAIREAGRTVD